MVARQSPAVRMAALSGVRKPVPTISSRIGPGSRGTLPHHLAGADAQRSARNSGVSANSPKTGHATSRYNWS